VIYLPGEISPFAIHFPRVIGKIVSVIATKQITVCPAVNSKFIGRYRYFPR